MSNALLSLINELFEMDDVRLIAFYLPQYHPIPENDAWWGRGFTEWTNVAGAKPLFPGHYQPHIPADLGFYDLRLAEVREQQARLAQVHGIYGFCYYYYCFNGKRLLNRPLDEVLATGKPDFPFCVCWANENWTRNWDGYDQDILIEQNHSPEDDLGFIMQLIPCLTDKRYIRVGNRLLLLVYRSELFPDPVKTAELWRKTVMEQTGEELFLCAVNSHDKKIDPRAIGFDGVVQFPFDYTPGCVINNSVFAASYGIKVEDIRDNLLLDYPAVVEHFVGMPKPDFPFFRGVFPSWDNTPRRKKSGIIFHNSSPELYKLFLKSVIGLTREEHSGDERLVFINAWNEWAEGAHLEPDRKYGMQFLEATRDALQGESDTGSLLTEVREKRAESGLWYSETEKLLERLQDSSEHQREPTNSGESVNIRLINEILLLNRKIGNLELRISHSAGLIEQKNLQLLESAELLTDKEAKVAALDHLLQDTKARLVQQESIANEAIRQQEAKIAELKDAGFRLNNLRRELKELETASSSTLVKLKDMEQMVLSFHESLSWKITGPLRWFHGSLFRVFYLFCPYGSKRWLLFKTFSRIMLHPARYLKQFRIAVVKEYLNILFHQNLVRYNKQVERANDHPGTLSLPGLEEPVPLSFMHGAMDADINSAELIFICYAGIGEDAIRDMAGDLLRNYGVNFPFMVVGSSGSDPGDQRKRLNHVDPGQLQDFLLQHGSVRYIGLINKPCSFNRETLPVAISTLEKEGQASMVVPKSLIYPHRLQSAGTIIWNDGSCCEFGKNEDPVRPEFNYLREVDSGNGFALVKAKEFMDWVKNPDAGYSDGLYRLHDLAMFIRQSGKKVFYQPLAEVTVGLRNQEEINEVDQHAFAQRWNNQLSGGHLPCRPENMFLARERGQGRRYMLMIEYNVPFFDKDAGSKSMCGFIDLFVQKGIVLKYLSDFFYPEKRYREALEQKSVEVLHGKYYEENFEDWLRSNQSHLSYAFLSRPTIAIKYIELIRKLTKAKILYYGHDLHYLRKLRQYEIEKTEDLLRSAQEFKETESRIFEITDVIYYLSSAEIGILRSEFGIIKPARAIPYIYKDFYTGGYSISDRNDLLFVGSFLHQPNMDAVLWFLAEVWPLVTAVFPAIQFNIVGSDPPEEFSSMASGNVNMLGFLSNEALEQTYLHSRLVVAPLRYGAGVKGKIVEAMYYGLPVVTTTIGAEGLDGSEETLEIHDDAEHFAQAIISLYGDENRLTERSAASCNYVKTWFSQAAAYEIFRKDIDFQHEQ